MCPRRFAGKGRARGDRGTLQITRVEAPQEECEGTAARRFAKAGSETEAPPERSREASRPIWTTHTLCLKSKIVRRRAAVAAVVPRREGDPTHQEQDPPRLVQAMLPHQRRYVYEKQIA